jgi:hypothetical protein
MPIYHNLEPKKWDNSKRILEKKRIADSLLRLRKALRIHLRLQRNKESRDESLDSEMYIRLATWNIRELGANKKFGNRLEESLFYISEILSHFDLIAIQEVNEDLHDLNRITSILGKGSWGYIATDATEGHSGNGERMAFVYNKNKVQFKDIAGEVVLPKDLKISAPFSERLCFENDLSIKLPEGTSLKSPSNIDTYRRQGKEHLNEEVEVELPENTWLKLPKEAKIVLPRRTVVKKINGGEISLPEGSDVNFPQYTMINLPDEYIVSNALQFARTPFLVSFQSAWLKLNLCTVHIYYGTGKEGLYRRNQEIVKLTEFLAKRAENEMKFDPNSFFVALGDFNIVGRDHVTMQSLISNGFQLPEKLQSIPSGSNVAKDKFYDQIAYWTDKSEEASRKSAYTNFEVTAAGIFDFFNTVFRYDSGSDNGGDEEMYREFMKPEWEYKEWRTFQMSDHLPMWVELRTDFGDEYLNYISKE